MYSSATGLVMKKKAQYIFFSKQMKAQIWFWQCAVAHKWFTRKILTGFSFRSRLIQLTSLTTLSMYLLGLSSSLTVTSRINYKLLPNLIGTVRILFLSPIKWSRAIAICSPFSAETRAKMDLGSYKAWTKHCRSTPL